MTNTGNVTLSTISVTDDRLGPIGTIPTLAPGGVRPSPRPGRPWPGSTRTWGPPRRRTTERP
ncbi:MAG: hypothetical protein ACUVQS_05005 [Candidatus Bipolaricaulaceae bacterium]